MTITAVWYYVLDIVLFVATFLSYGNDIKNYRE